MACFASSSKLLLDGTVSRTARSARAIGFAAASSSRAQRYSSSSSQPTSTITSSTALPTLPPSLLSLLHPPTPLPRPHSIHTASLHLSAYTPQPLTLACLFAQRSAHSLGIPISNPFPLPTTKSLYTVLKSPFVHKKSQENFERKIHRRVIKVWDTDMEVLEVYLRYLQGNGVAGVRMKVSVIEYLELDKVAEEGEGKEEEGTMKSKVMKAVEGAKRDLKADENAETVGKESS